MAIIHKAIPLNGSANLNFNVVGSVSAPSKPKENTVWVKTAAPISKWSLDGREPVSPIDGQVWVQTLNSGGAVSFNAFKKNSLHENLNMLRQLSSIYGWENKSAYIYQNAQWTQFSQETDIAIMEKGVLDPTRISYFDNGLTINVGTGGDRDSGMTASQTSTAGNAINLSMFTGIRIKGIATAGASSHGGCNSTGTLILSTSSGNHTIASSFAESGGSVPSSVSQPFETTINTTFLSSERLSFTVNFVFNRWAGASNGGVGFEITDIYLIK